MIPTAMEFPCDFLISVPSTNLCALLLPCEFIDQSSQTDEEVVLFSGMIEENFFCD